MCQISHTSNKVSLITLLFLSAKYTYQNTEHLKTVHIIK